MKFPSKKPALVATHDKSEPSPQVKDCILVAKGTVHAGAFFGIISNGGKKSVGNFIIEVVRNGSMFATVQIYQSSLGITPQVQTWQKTKTVATPKANKAKAQTELKTETLTVNTSVESEDLF